MRVLFLAPILLGACTFPYEVRSDDAAVAPEASIDAATDDECAESPGVARFCATISAVRAHPPYDTASGAGELKIDGNGVVIVTLYDADPGILGGAPKPVAQMQFPTDASKTVAVDSLPVTVRGSAPPGTYWYVAMFADNPAPRTGLMAGDFVLSPKLEGKKPVHPRITLENGKTARLDLALRPLRRVDVGLTVGTEIRATALVQKSINGDGPVMFGLYDGDFSATATNLLGIDVVPCVDMRIQMAAPPQSTSFLTTIDGSHRLMAVLFDNLLTGPVFPFKGSLMAPWKPVDAPLVNISTTSWRSTTSVPLTELPVPPGATDPDPIHCP